MATARGETVELVRRLAGQAGVSERTVYRWFKAIRESGSMEILPGACEACGKQLPAGSTIRRRYCDGTCRQAGNRRKQRQTPENALP